MERGGPVSVKSDVLFQKGGSKQGTKKCEVSRSCQGQRNRSSLEPSERNTTFDFFPEIHLEILNYRTVE